MIVNLSPSRADQFKRCPKQFKFSNIDKIIEPTTKVQAKGTTVHKALEDIYDLRPEDRTIDNLKKLFKDTWTKERKNPENSHLFKNIDEEIQWGNEGYSLLENYLKMENPILIEPVKREQWLEGDVKGTVNLENDGKKFKATVKLRGILDRLDRDENNKLVIVDYKSGKSPNKKYVKNQNDKFFALLLYALLIKQEFNETPIEVRLIYLGDMQILPLKVTQKNLNEAKEKLLKIWLEIKNAEKNNNFPPIKNNLCNNFCYYKNICPLFNNNYPDTDILNELNNKIVKTKNELEIFQEKNNFKVIEERINSITDQLSKIDMFESSGIEKITILEKLKIQKLKNELEKLKSKVNIFENLKNKLNESTLKKDEVLFNIHNLLKNENF